MARIITKREAKICLWYFKKHIHPDAQLIGSFGKGAETSDHDIDIYIPAVDGKAPNLDKINLIDKDRFSELLDAEKVEKTDWGGWYFHNTIFGDVDVFFDISELN